jgi:UDP-N-acetylmuramyl pentapeptide phosphotransferase/UDP-N-acetylglucosamine-1-phosphate transferase
MVYLIVIIVLFVSELLYFKIADRFNIIDKPNERSSHTQITLRGGGIIYWIAAVLFTAFHLSTFSSLFLLGITLMGGISFLDDIKSVSQKIRLLAHLAGMTFVFLAINAFGSYPWWVILLAYIVFIGIVNAYNFMDGINGITGLYTLAVLLPMLYVNEKLFAFTDTDFLIYPLLASLVFLFFNFRKQAKCFAGDVGSVTVAFWVIVLLLMLIVKTESLVWIGFLIVYGVDTVLTILHRIFLKQNIMEAHRLHFYQILVNELKQSHLLVSTFYFVTQLLCSALIIYFFPLIGWWIIGILLLLLVGIYMLKFKMMSKPAV